MKRGDARWTSSSLCHQAGLGDAGVSGLPAGTALPLQRLMGELSQGNHISFALIYPAAAGCSLDHGQAAQQVSRLCQSAGISPQITARAFCPQGTDSDCNRASAGYRLISAPVFQGADQRPHGTHGMPRRCCVFGRAGKCRLDPIAATRRPH